MLSILEREYCFNACRVPSQDNASNVPYSTLSIFQLTVSCYTKHHKFSCVTDTVSIISLSPHKFARIKYIKPIIIG